MFLLIKIMANHEGFFKWTFGHWPYWVIGGFWSLISVLLDDFISIGTILGTIIGVGLVLLVPFALFWVIWFKVTKR